MSDTQKSPPSTASHAGVFVVVFIVSFALTIGLLALNRQRQQRTEAPRLIPANQPVVMGRVEAQRVAAPIDERPRMPKDVQAIKLEVVRVDSEEISAQPGSGQNAVDGDPRTYWHTEWRDSGPPPPHEIVIELIPPALIKGFTYLPRQDESDHGQIKDYELYVSNDGLEFTQPVIKGTFTPGKNRKAEMFEAVKARYIKLKALSEINGLAWTSAAEIGVVQAE